MGEGLAITGPRGQVRLKWHRLRRRPTDAEFDPTRLAEGLSLGASMEVDLQALADGFAVLHDPDLSGETTGRGPVSLATRADLRRLRLRHLDRAPLTAEDLSALLGEAHSGALLQLDMKNRRAEVSAAHIAHLAEVFGPHAGRLIASGACEALIADLAEALPGLARGLDPTDDLVALAPDLGAMERRLKACLSTRPAMVYLNWQMLLATAALDLDMVALAHAEGVAVDAWTHAMASPDRGFSPTEAEAFAALLELGPDQITTDAPLATEAAWAQARKIGLVTARS